MCIEILTIFILGLVFGSFISALTWRLPRGIQITKGRSICPKCKSIIAWYDNIPVFSYFLLGGKCRNCRAKISLRYPLIEISTALVFALIFLRFGFSPLLIILSIILISIFVIDTEHQLIPDELVFIGLAILLFSYLATDFDKLFVYLLSGIVAALFLLAVHAATRGRGMGLGDVKLALLLGSYLGPVQSVYWMSASFIIGAVFASFMLLIGNAKLKDKIAFGPFLILGFAGLLLLS